MDETYASFIVQVLSLVEFVECVGLQGGNQMPKLSWRSAFAGSFDSETITKHFPGSICVF